MVVFCVFLFVSGVLHRMEYLRTGELDGRGVCERQ